jgi:hypothetical protein
VPAASDLVRKPNETWTNLHGTVKVKLHERITIFNRQRGKSSAEGMRETAGRIQALIADAVAQGRRLRAVGSRWSFSDVAAAEGGVALETQNLDMSFSIPREMLDPAFRGTAEELLLAQCGRPVSRINMALEDKVRGRALRTSGASNGQTVAGMIGTGTHGSAVDVAACESQVAGLQLLTATRNIWLESPRDPVLGRDFAAALGAELVRDEALFRTALVHLGMLGFVHAVLLRSTGRYRLLSSLTRMRTSDVERALNTLDFTGAPLPDPTQRPYFFQAVVEPSEFDTAYVTVRYKVPCPPDYQPDYSLKSGYEPGNDLPGLVGKLLDVAPAMRPMVAPLLIRSELAPFSGRLRTPGETYNHTSAKSGVAGAANAVPVAYTMRALRAGQRAFAAVPGAPIAFACRFAQKSPALLGFTRFDPTCIIDVDGVESRATRDIMERVRRNYEEEGIPFAQHWGKLHGLTRERVRASYGSAVDDWTAARHRLLPSNAERDTFSTPLFDSIGLND